MKCEKCGHEMQIGDYPFCPHERGIGGYDPFTPVVDEMIADEPMTFTNRGERSRYMDRNAIVPKDVSHKNPNRKKLYFY